MSKELKIGFISLSAIAIMIWGFQYMKGKNILKKVSSYEVVYKNVEGLSVAAPVEINGYGVGSVSSIELNPEDVRSMLVKFEVQGNFKFPKETRAILATDNGLTGTKKLIIDFDRLCDGDDCLMTGERMEGSSRGMLQTLLGEDEMSEYFINLRNNAGPVIDTVLNRLGSKESDNLVSSSLRNLEASLGHLASLSKNMDLLLKNSHQNLNKSIDNMAVVTGSFANTNEELENLVKNLSTLSSELAEAGVGETIGKASEALTSTNDLMKELKTTVDKANESFSNMNNLLTKMDSGEGSIAKLLNNPEIYDNLEATSKHLSLLLQDMRLNPKRYVRLSVFGRKGDPYTNPSDDPAFEANLKKNDN